jgi:nucleotide-binding universal stress UspA family protein
VACKIDGRPRGTRIPAPVLAAVDPRAPDPAPIRFAAAVAGHTGAPLTVAGVVGDGSAVTPLAAGQSGEELGVDASAALERAVRIARDAGVEAEPVVLAAVSAPRGLALAATELGAGLVVVGSAAGGRPGQLHPGPTAARLLNGSPSAVAVVPAGWDGRALATIAAGFAHGAEARAAVREAHALAVRAGARLRVLAAVRQRAWSHADAGELRALAEEAAGAAVPASAGAPVDVDVVVGEPADVLVAVSGELDLLVCGTRGYGPRPATLLGGVTRRLVAEARCPVAVLSGESRTSLGALVG